VTAQSYTTSMVKPHVYIFRGAPASGKGSITPKFCNLLPQPVALVEQDQFRWGLHLIGRNIPDIQEEEHMLAYRNTVLIYEQYLKTGKYAIVVEGLFTWDDKTSSQGNAKELIELAKQYGFPCKSIVLRADKEELLKRNAARSYSVPLLEFEKLYDNIYSVVDEDELVIDSTGQSLDATLQLLKAKLGLL